MKLIYFLIILVIIYFVATQIKVTHVDNLPDQQKKELGKRSKLRSRLLSNHIKHNKSKNPNNKICPVEKFCNSDKLNDNDRGRPNFKFDTNRLIGYTDRYSADQYNSPNYKHNYYDFSNSDRTANLPNASNLLSLIKNEYIDLQYKFNLPNLPVTTRYPNRNTLDMDRKYIKHIKKDIISWNELFRKYYEINKKLIEITNIKIIFVMETSNEFLLKANVALKYLNRSMHYQVTYYGQIDRSDDFLNGGTSFENATAFSKRSSPARGTDVYTLQLTEVRPIAKSEFAIEPTSMNENNDDYDGTPFISMKQQLQYVDKINQLHKDEMA